MLPWTKTWTKTVKIILSTVDQNLWTKNLVDLNMDQNLDRKSWTKTSYWTNHYEEKKRKKRGPKVWAMECKDLGRRFGATFFTRFWSTGALGSGGPLNVISVGPGKASPRPRRHGGVSRRLAMLGAALAEPQQSFGEVSAGLIGSSMESRRCFGGLGEAGWVRGRG